MIATAPDVVGLTVSLCKSVLTSVSGAGRGGSWEVVVSGVPGVENATERADILMEAVVVVICVEVSRGGVEFGPVEEETVHGETVARTEV